MLDTGSFSWGFHFLYKLQHSPWSATRVPVCQFYPLTHYSEVQSPHDLGWFLCTKLEEKVTRVKDLEGELEVAQSRVQVADECEEFLLTELSAQVTYLDNMCPIYYVLFLFYFGISPD
jgi:hypothetical protein